MVRLIGHRGASASAPENTLASVRAAFEHGVGAEVDLQLLRDGTLVVLHDDTLERTSTKDASTAHRTLIRTPVARLRWADVKDMDVGMWYSASFAGETLPLFSDVLLELKKHDAPGGSAHLFAELKGERPHDPRLPELAARAVSHAHVPPHALTFISFSLPLLVEMKRVAPQYAALYIANPPNAEAAWRAAKAAVSAHLDGVDFRADPALVTADLCEWMHARGKRVAVWVSRAPAKEDCAEVWEQLTANGVDELTSNLPPEIWGWRARAERESDARVAAGTALGVSAAFGASMLATNGSWQLSEDLVDLAHSVIGTACSARAFAASGLRPPPPPQLAWYPSDKRGEAARRLCAAPVLPPAEDALARRFVLASTSYFALDVAHIFASLVSGRAPHQWRGRLAHHAIQFVANAPALARDAPRVAAVVRRYLLLAYIAEASTVVLRLRSLAQAGGIGGEGLQRALGQALLVSFVLTRLIGFPLQTLNIWRAEHALPRGLWRLHLAFAGAGILLSSGWFAMLLRKGGAQQKRRLA